MSETGDGRWRRTHGKTASGVPITDELVAELAANAETGYDVDEMLRRRPTGRQAVGPPE